MQNPRNPVRIIERAKSRSIYVTQSASLHFRMLYNYRFRVNNRDIAVGLAQKREGMGGVRNHLNAIKKYSKHNVKLVPDKFLMEYIAKTGQLKNFRYILESLGLEKFKIAHSHVDPQFINLCFEAQKTGTRWIHTYHTLYFEDQWEGGLKEWQKVINQVLLEKAKHADVKISISHWLHDYLLEYFNIDTIVIPNGVDLQKCKRAAHLFLGIVSILVTSSYL